MKIKEQVYLDEEIYALLYLKAREQEKYCTKKCIKVSRYINDILKSILKTNDLSDKERQKIINKAKKLETQDLDEELFRNARL